MEPFVTVLETVMNGFFLFRKVQGFEFFYIAGFSECTNESLDGKFCVRIPKLSNNLIYGTDKIIVREAFRGKNHAVYGKINLLFLSKLNRSR